MGEIGYKRLVAQCIVDIVFDRFLMVHMSLYIRFMTALNPLNVLQGKFVQLSPLFST
jgi:hypothetical protein